MFFLWVFFHGIYDICFTPKTIDMFWYNIMIFILPSNNNWICFFSNAGFDVETYTLWYTPDMYDDTAWMRAYSCLGLGGWEGYPRLRHLAKEVAGPWVF